MLPKWATPERQAHLVNLFLKSHGFCVFGEHPCTNPEVHHYEPYAEAIIKDWLADDREARAYLLRLQRQALHRLPERGAIRGAFSAISRDIYFETQPQYFMEAIGISAVNFHPFAKIRIASSYTRLHVDLGEAFKGLSKNKRRKVVRYSQAFPVPIAKQIEYICNRAIAHYLSKAH